MTWPPSTDQPRANEVAAEMPLPERRLSPSPRRKHHRGNPGGVRAGPDQPEDSEPPEIHRRDHGNMVFAGEVVRDIDHRKIREFKRSALHFLLDVRKPQPVRIEASGAPGRRASLIETVKDMLETREVTPGIDRKSMVDLGMHYLLEADRLEPALTGDEV